jgi:hypothetical protein
MVIHSTVITRAARSYLKRHEVGTPVFLKRIYQYSSCIDHTVSHLNVKVTGTGGFTGMVMIMLVNDDNMTVIPRYRSIQVCFNIFY